jgi:hypothetical protein
MQTRSDLTRPNPTAEERESLPGGRGGREATVATLARANPSSGARGSLPEAGPARSHAPDNDYYFKNPS